MISIQRELYHWRHVLDVCIRDERAFAITRGCEYLIVAGYGRMAYDILSALLHSDLCPPEQNHVWQSIDMDLMPGLCWAFGLDFPASRNRMALAGEALRTHIEDMEGTRFWNAIGCFSVNDSEFQRQWPQWKLNRITAYLSSAENPTLTQQIQQVEVWEPSDDECGRFAGTHIKYIRFLVYNQRYQEALKHTELHETKLLRFSHGSYLDKFWLAGWLASKTLGREEQATRYLKEWWLTSDLQRGQITPYWPIVIKALAEGTLRDYIGLPENEAETFKQAALNSLSAPDDAGPPSESDWHGLLENWQRLYADKFPDEAWESFQKTTPEQAKNKTSFFPPVDEAGLWLLEQRLGCTLPTGYRNFLKCSGGWLLLDDLIRLVGPDGVDWFKYQNAEWIKVWQDEESDSFSEPTSSSYNSGQHPGLGSPDLGHTLQISNTMDGTVFLLNPKVINGYGEWEAWDLSVKTPGIERYRSFWHLMRVLYIRSLNHARRF